ncbi:MAG: azurin [Opitutus sp.]|nr:azurin [Opitutus sp.]
MKSKFFASLLVATIALAVGSPVPAADSPRVVTIRAGVDNAMKFDVTSIAAAPGESIKVVLINAGVLPKNVMGHNWVLLTAGTDPVAFAATAAPEVASEYLPEKQKDKIVAFIRLLGPKETGEVVFKVPTEPGEYPFLCTFPAHCAVGMKGVLVVKK